MIAILWVLLVLAVAANGVVMTVNVRLVRMARAGQAGSEIIQLGLAPLYRVEYVLRYLGGFSGLILSGVLSGPVAIVTGVLGGALLLLAALDIVVFLRELWHERKLSRANRRPPQPQPK